MASRPLFAHTGDWHTNERTWASRDIVGDSYHALRFVVSYCLDAGIDLLGAGDLLDSPDPSSADVYFLKGEINRLHRARRKFHYVQGNHDYIHAGSDGIVRRRPWMGAISSWPIHAHRKTFELGAFTVHGLDYQPKSRLVRLLAAAPRHDILFCHQTWRETSGGEQSVRVADVPHARYVLSGDYHEHFCRTYERESPPRGTPRKVALVSPGPLCMQAVNEEAECRFYVFDDQMKPTSVRIPGRIVRREVVNDPSELDDLISHGMAFLDELAAANAGLVPAELAKPILHVEHSTAIGECRARIEKAAGGRYHLFFKAAAGTSKEASPEVDRAAVRKALAANGMRGVLEKADLGHVREQHGADPEEVRSDAMAFLQSADPGGLFDEMIAEA